MSTINRVPKNTSTRPIELDGQARLHAALEKAVQRVHRHVQDGMSIEQAIERIVRKAKFDLRHQPRLEQAQIWLRLCEIYSECAGKRPSTTIMRHFDELVFGDRKKVKTRMRWVRAALVPKEVLQAYQDGKIVLRDVERVAVKSVDVQHKIARQLREGRDPARVIATLAPTYEYRNAVESAMDRVRKKWPKDLEVLIHHFQKSGRWPVTSADLPLLRSLNKQIVSMIRYVKDNPEKCMTADQRLHQCIEEIKACGNI